jgi:diacylglycerol O-acyltransferase
MPSLPHPLAPMPMTDSMFLIAESRRQPMHTGLLMLFEPGADGPPDMAALHHRLVEATDIAPQFRRRPVRGARSLGQWAWELDPEVELEHHIRRSALPSPGRPRELLELTGRLHATLLDQRRPLWEAHLIEGVSERRWAIYTKVHHSVMDGVSGLRLLTSTLGTDPFEHGGPAPWETGAVAARAARSGAAQDARASADDRDPGRLTTLAGRIPAIGPAAQAATATAVETAGRLAGPLVAAGAGAVDAAGIVPAALRALRRGLTEQAAALPYTAPRTILNVEISSSRRFAADSWDLERIRGVARSLGGTVNDVVLAMCSGALRSWLAELGALPDSPLVAMVPMSLRDEASPEAGNAVGAILTNLGTDQTSAGARFERVHDSVLAAKRSFAGLSQAQALALSAPGMLPFALDRIVPGTSTIRPPFNIVISNVPGPTQQRYYEGAALRGLYPLSIPLDGQAMNITVVSNADQLGFGIVGCRRNAPHLQRLLAGLETELTALERSAG